MSFTNFEIIAGTYEEYLVGYIFSSQDNSLVQSFASHDHSSSIRCLATSDFYLASGAADDRIIIYDLRARKEHCMLTHHNSTVTSLAFTDNHSHVISASQDGAMGIVRVGNWQVEKLWDQAHKEGGEVLDIAVHSSGKLALTLSKDAKIHTWNLVKGREAYVINLKTKCKDPKNVERIIFAPGDVRFVIYGGKFTEVWSIAIGGAVSVIEHDERVTACAWLDDKTLFAGYESGKISVVDVESGKKTVKDGHNGRIKAAQYFEGYIATGSSTGEIKIWTRKLKEICKVSTGCRITCMIIAKWCGKVKKEESEEENVPEQVPRSKPVRSRVVVEVEDSSEGEREEVHKNISKKRKKKSQAIEEPKKKKGQKSSERQQSGEDTNIVKPKKQKVNLRKEQLKLKKKKKTKLQES
ncbi:p21-activated protein kinase-interacting protein 1-like [Anthonomus grandis grandis]|uniref:p21-activated protein kinase-interacting protein 1-like n=1 Tax=Anthonomus grandis grandis TaxID=2921223 RepID=UPI0021652824|nr:p21-activated protein kinase-interacting protein 1-like [Anthonomus grandis grandis]